MLANQVFLILDDDAGSGEGLIERFLLEEARVICFSPFADEYASRWGDEVHGRWLYVFGNQAMESEELFLQEAGELLSKIRRIDGMIQFKPYAAAQARQSFESVTINSNWMHLFLEPSKGASLVLLRKDRVSIELDEHQELVQMVADAGEQYISTGIRHNLIIHEARMEETKQLYGYVNAALFLSTDWGQNIYGQVMVVKDPNQPAD